MANPSLFYCLRFVFQNLFSRIFKVVTVQLSRFRPLCSRNSSIILAYRFVLVKYFFNFFKISFWFILLSYLFFEAAHRRNVWYHTTFSFLCQHLFNFFKKFSRSKRHKKISQKRERRRRDLNPRTAQTVYTLSRGASSATWVLLLNQHFFWYFCSLICDAHLL